MSKEEPVPHSIIDLACPLCRREELTKLLYEDPICWVTYCASHPDKILVVLNRHTKDPSEEEISHLWRVIESKFPGRKWRGPAP